MDNIDIGDKKVIALSGPKYSGKDTAAKILTSKSYCEHQPFAKGVKTVVKSVFGLTDQLHIEDPIAKELGLDFYPYEPPRVLMMDVANWFRDRFGPDIWLHQWARTVRESDKPLHIVTDLRFPNEVTLMESLNIPIIYVYRREAERDLQAARNSGDHMALNVSESHYETIRMFSRLTITNDGSVSELQQQFINAVDLVRPGLRKKLGKVK